ncbi:MAG: enolase [Candidatus Berkelbacteria bacterium Licking1014_7]|uniref:Enolase n=1 Tax=Candidatus Berkelbacteria bacterium Licking1014_7 TaxID=2017147 RepID=A0A554LJH7_9BACT|nr:MAG: enolase [Candidatus Berkelbacteria bacterium Licking1014_7]
MPVIKNITGQKIYNSLGDPALEVEVELDSGEKARASAPSGAIVAKYEAVDIKNIDHVAENANGIILQNLKGKDIFLQAEIDKTLINLDGTENKSQLGANALLSVSIAVARVASLAQKMPFYQYLAKLYGGDKQVRMNLPSPMFNLINGGVHADNNLTMQDFMVVPIDSDLSFSQKMAIGVKIFKTLEKKLKLMGKAINVGDEGGFAPQLNSNEEALEFLVEAIKKAGFAPGKEVVLAVDVAADNIPQLSIATYPYQPIDYYRRVCVEYPLTILEDPFKQDDWQGWADATADLGSKIAIVGDDLFSTNINRLKKGIEMKAGNSISVKPNQIGTLSETFAVIKLAREANFEVQISHRAGETEDDFIADLAVAVGAKYLKAGAPNRGELPDKFLSVK